MDGSLTVRGMKIGGGHTRICVPIMPTTLCELTEILGKLDTAALDIVEWRADALQGANLADYLTGLGSIRQKLGETVPILFTLRTSGEGGGFFGTEDTYTALLIEIAQTGSADVLDVELSAGDENVRAAVNAAVGAGIKVVISHHNFNKTYPHQEIADICKHMFELGADIAKIAIMPANLHECLMLMDAAQELLCEFPNKATILIGMGRHGISSRIMAREIGSCITFAYDTAANMSVGAVASAIAPAIAIGQISSADMRKILEITSRYENY